MPIGAGFQNTLVFAENAEFTGAIPNPTGPSGSGLRLDKQIWLGTTALNAGGTHVNVATLADGVGIAITQVGTTLTITNTAPAGSPVTVSGGTNINVSSIGTAYTVNLNDPIKQQNDTAGAPSYSFATTPTSGMYSDGTNTQMSWNGSKSFTFGFANQSVNLFQPQAGMTLSHIIVNTTPYVSFANSIVYDVDTSALAITIRLPNAPQDGEWFIVKDYTGSAATRNITVTTPGGTVLFDGATTNLIATNYGSAQYIFNGSTGNYEVFSPSFTSNDFVTLNNGNNITVTGGNPLSLGGTASFNITGTTNHALQIGNGTGSLTSIAVGSTGQVLQANSAADPTWSTATYPSTTTINQVLYSSANNVVGGITASNNGVLISGTTGIPSWLAAGTTGQILTATTGNPPSWASPAAQTDLHTARYIVSAGGTADGANYTTIATAITAAVAAGGNQTVFIQPGTYTENLTLAANIDLCAYSCDKGSVPSAAHVIINGKCTATFAGSASFSGIRFKTNSDFLCVVSGSAATLLTFINCYFDATNNSAFSISSSGGPILYFFECEGDLGTTGINYFTATNNYLIRLFYTLFLNSNVSSTTNTFGNTGGIEIYYSFLSSPVVINNTATITCSYSSITSGVTAVTINSTSASNSIGKSVVGGPGAVAAVTVAAGGTITILDSIITAATTNVITGAGTILYAGLTFNDSGSNITTTTQTLLNEGPKRTIGSSNSGGTNTLTVTNSSNTASSNSAIVATVGGTSSADAYYQAVVAGTTTWTWGVDNSDSDAWALSANAALGTTNVMHASTAGQINYPLQPSFSAYLNTGVTNVTGDATNYTVIFDTKSYDIGTNFSTSTGLFTAPVAGKYLFTMAGTLSGIGAAHTKGLIVMIISGLYYSVAQFNPGTVRELSGNTAGFSGCITVNMAANDTAGLIIQVSNSTKTIGVLGVTSSVIYTYLSGNLVS